jgi:hypothetical protein
VGVGVLNEAMIRAIFWRVSAIENALNSKNSAECALYVPFIRNGKRCHAMPEGVIIE